MDLKVKHTPVLVKEVKRVKAFLTIMLGFQFCELTGPADERQGILVAATEDSECYLLLEEDQHPKNVDTGPGMPMIIRTDDCLKDYFTLADKGVLISKKPEYSSKGLSVEISDPWGNSYILLEERNYQD